MKINPFAYGIMVLTVFLGVILSAQQLGVWSTSGKVASSGEAVQPSAGDVSSVKGWMTLEQVSTTFNAPLPEVTRRFSSPFFKLMGKLLPFTPFSATDIGVPLS